MNTRIISIAGFGWVPLAVLALWWTGFAPFPTAPLYMSWTRYVYCDYDDPDAKRCSDLTYINTHNDHYRFSNDAPEQSERCKLKKMNDDPSVGLTNWECNDQKSVPRFGLGSARWVVVETELVTPEADKPDPPKGSTGIYTTYVAAYASYGACIYRQPKDTPFTEGNNNTVWRNSYECKPVGSFRR